MIMARKKENLLGEMKKNITKVAEKSGDINEKQPTQVSVDNISGNDANYFNMENDPKYEALKLSIERVGILSPLTVQESGVNDRGEKQYVLISGHRRLKAAKELNYEVVPVHVIFSDSSTDGLTDANTTSREITVDEYITAIEEVERDIKENHIKVEGRKTAYIGKRLGLSHNQVSRYVRIKKLIPELRRLLDDKMITLNTASEWAALDEEKQNRLYDRLNIGVDPTADSDKISEALAKQIKREIIGIDVDVEHIDVEPMEDEPVVSVVTDNTSDDADNKNVVTQKGNGDIKPEIKTPVSAEKHAVPVDTEPVEPVKEVDTEVTAVTGGDDDNAGNQEPVEVIKKQSNVVSNIKRYVDGILNECSRVEDVTDSERDKVVRQLKMCREFIDETLNKWEVK